MIMSDVSVIMAVYNGGSYLGAAVESILHQTHRDFEFIIVDDGSTDGTPAVLERYAAQDSRIRVTAADHKGVVHALNLAVALARGSILVRMDHDDVAWPQRIERQLAFLEAHPKVAAAGSAIRVVNKLGQPIRVVRYDASPEKLREGLHRGGSPIAHPSAAIRRDALAAVGGFRPAFIWAEDFDLWCRLSERYDLANLREVLLDYRWHGENTSARQRHRQALAGNIAWLASRERRQGRPDPSLGLDRLEFRDLDRFDNPASERASILYELSEAGLVAYRATRCVQYLADVEECLRAATKTEFDPTRTARIHRELARHFWRTGAHRRSLAVAVLGTAGGIVAPLHKMRECFTRLPRRHERSGNRLIADWIIHCADPLGPRTEPPQSALPPETALDLVTQADDHGVLPAVLRHFRPFHDDVAFAAARSEATMRYRTRLSVALMLRRQADAVAKATADLPAAIVKGPVFASRIYPEAGLRPFGDIDVLVARDALPELASRLAALGFMLAQHDGRAVPQEWKWVHRDNAVLMVEAQTDLVHAASLRGAMSLTYDVIAGRQESPAVQLLVAVVHGSLGAHFEQMRNLVDICQAARAIATAADEEEFEVLTEKSGTRFAARVGLELAGRVLAEPRCLVIARALRPARHTRVASLLIDRTVVMSTMTPERWIHAWRRQAFRYLLKRS